MTDKVLDAQHADVVKAYDELEKLLTDTHAPRSELQIIRLSKGTLNNQRSILKLYEHITWLTERQATMFQSLSHMRIALILALALLVVNVLVEMFVK
jgi:hypothetical protein